MRRLRLLICAKRSLRDVQGGDVRVGPRSCCLGISRGAVFVERKDFIVDKDNERSGNVPVDAQLDFSWLDEEAELLGIVIPSDALRVYGRSEYRGRSVERMQPFLQQLEQFWRRHPDWRFGQMMCNLDRRYRAMHDDNDFFYLEEDEFLAFLEECEDRG